MALPNKNRQGSIYCPLRALKDSQRGSADEGEAHEDEGRAWVFKVVFEALANYDPLLDNPGVRLV